MLDDNSPGQVNVTRSPIAGALLSAVLVLALAVALVPAASADIDNRRSTIVQEGDNENETDQDGRASSGDVVAGQVAGVVSSGDTSLDATNLSSDVDAESGDAEGANSTTSFTGTHVFDTGCPPAGADRPRAQACPKQADATDIDNLIAVIVHLGDNTSSIDQSADVSTGDVVAGQVVGAVVSGLADIVVANTSADVDAESGDGEFTNLANVAVVSTSIVFARRCAEGCPLPVDVAALLEGGTDVVSREVGAPVGFRDAMRPEAAGLGASGVLMVGLSLLGAVWSARRRRVAVPALASSGSQTARTSDRTGSVAKRDVVKATVIVLGAFLIARSIDRK